MLELVKQVPVAAAMIVIVWLFLEHQTAIDVECHRMHQITFDQTNAVLTLTRASLHENTLAFGALDSCLQRTVTVLERIERKLDER